MADNGKIPHRFRKRDWATELKVKTRLVRPDHLEHIFRPDLEIIAPAAGAHDGTRQCGLVDAVLDEGLVDMDGDHLAQREPGLRLLAVGALQLDDLRQFAFKRHRAFRHPRDLDKPAWRLRQPGYRKLVDVMGDMRGG